MSGSRVSTYQMKTKGIRWLQLHKTTTKWRYGYNYAKQQVDGGMDENNTSRKLEEQKNVKISRKFAINNYFGQSYYGGNLTRERRTESY